MIDDFTPTTEQVRDGYASDPEAEYRDPVGYGSYEAGLRRAFDRWLAQHDAAVLAERDALRAQLDAMTVEWETVSNDDPPIRTHNWKPEEMDHLRSFAKRSGSRIMQRLVGPWVEVTEARGNVSTSNPSDDHICDTDCHEDQCGTQWHTAEGASDEQQ